MLSSERRNSRPKGSTIFRRILLCNVSKILSFDSTHMIKEWKDQQRVNRLTAQYRQSMMYLFKSEISRLIELRYNKNKTEKNKMKK